MSKTSRQAIAPSATTPIDFKVDPKTGVGYISQRKAAELCGLPLTTLHCFVKKSGTPSELNENIDTSQGLNADQLTYVVTHYASKRKRAAHILAFIAKTKHFTLDSLSSPDFYAHMSLLSGDGKTKTPNKEGYVYIVQCEQFYKIGKTNTPDAASRVATMQTGNPFELRLLRVKPVRDAFAAEAYLHYRFSKHHHRGEWFALDFEALTEVLLELDAL